MSEESFGYDFENDQPVVLGRGATGNTYRGWIRLPNKREGGQGNGKIPAALKEIGNATDGGSYSLKKEVHLLAEVTSLRHPCLVTYLGLRYPPAGPIIVTEFIDGATLQATVDDFAVSGQLSSRAWIARMLVVGRMLADAIAKCHGASIRHQDIKPGNVMIRRHDEMPVLIDFGVGHDDKAVTLNGTFTTRHFFGTPAYASPEQFCTGPGDCDVCDEKECEVSSKTDVYGLGGTLWYSLTRQYPFPLNMRHSGDLKPLARAKRQGMNEASSLPDIPPLRELLRAMLAGVSADRPTATEVEARLGEIFEKSFADCQAAAPYRATEERKSNAPRLRRMPEFVPVGAGAEIATTALQIFAQTYWSPALAERIDFTDVAAGPARMTFEGAKAIIATINHDPEVRPDLWRYRLPTSKEWMIAAGFDPEATGGAKQLYPRRLRDLNDGEYEWLDDPGRGGSFPECRTVRYLEGNAWRKSQRHEEWPKGLVRLVREKRTP